VTQRRPAARAVRGVARLLQSLPGIAGVCRLRAGLLARVGEMEARYEEEGFLPLRNLGMRAALARGVAFALLKDARFREPPGPTVCLVEELEPGEGAQLPAEQLISVEGGRYRVLGEEVLASRRPYRERTLSLGHSFVLFPDRRSRPDRPSFFLVPPLGFAELEQRQEELGIAAVISVSPCTRADSALRRACGFPQDPALATLIVAFDRRPAPALTRSRAYR
jgi:hypothetical protein